jgi:hypothetical protein
MLKYHNLISFGFGLLFLLVLQKFATPEPIFRFLVPAFLLFVVAVTFYNNWYLRKIGKYNFWVLLRAILLLLSGFGLFLIIPSESIRGLFLILTVFIITFLQMLLGNQAENILLNETLLIAFGLIFAFFGAYHYFPTNEPLFLAGIFFCSFLLSRSFYEFIPKPAQTKLVGALILGFFCSQLFWTLNFLPFHFSVLSALLFNIFYFCLILNYYHLFHILNFKKIQFHLLLILACDAAILLATPWRIVA